MEKALTKAMSAVLRAIGPHFVIGAVEWHGSNFRVWSASGPETSVQHMEAVAANLLQHVADAAAQGSCSECPACRTRHARAVAALAALHEPSQIVTEIVAGPTSEAVH